MSKNNKDKVKRFLDTTNKQIVLFASKNLSQTPYASDYIGHRFLTLKSDIISKENG